MRKILNPSWPLVLGILAVIFLIRFPLLMALGNPWLMDYQILHYTGQLVLQRDPAVYIKSYTPGMLIPYGPIWVLLTAPLGLLSFHQGCVVWTSLNVAFLILSLILCRNLCRLAGLQPSAWIAVLAVLILVKPLTSEFLMGQTNLLWLLCALGFMLAHLRQRPGLAGLCLALAISLKLPAVIFLVYLLIRKDLRTSVSTVLWFLGLNIGAAALLNPGDPVQIFKGWHSVLMQCGTTNAFRKANQTLLALFGRYLREDSYGYYFVTWPPGVIVALSLAAGALMFYFALEKPLFQKNRPVKQTLETLAILTVVRLVASPASWMQTYSVLLWPIFFMLTVLRTANRKILSSVRVWLPLMGLLLANLAMQKRTWRMFGLADLVQQSRELHLVWGLYTLFGLLLYSFFLGWRSLAQPRPSRRRPPGRPSPERT